MKPRQLLIALMLCLSFTIFGLQSKNTTVQNQPKQPSVVQLQQQNDTLKQKVASLEKSIKDCQDYNKMRESMINGNLNLWFTILTIVMALIGIVLGVAAPLYFNSRTDKNLKEEFKRQNDELKEQIKQTKADAQSAKSEAQSAKNALSEITRLKEQMVDIKDKVDNSKVKAEEAANKAKASELLSQAISENDPNKAIDLCSKAIDNYADFAEAYNYRALRKQDLGQFLEAIEDLNKAIKIKPDESLLFNNRGVIKHILHLYDDALKDLNQAIILNPNSIETYITKAFLLMEMRRHAEALGSVDEAIKRDTQNSSFYELRGDIEFEMYEYKGAIEDYTNAIQLNDRLISSYIKRAKCYRAWASHEQGEMVEERNAEFVKKAEEDEKRAEELKNNQSGTSSLALTHTK